MKAKSHTWRAGFQHKNVNPETVAKLLEKLPEVTPAAVLAEAEKKSSPLHKLFTWDDSDAAREYRLWQARRIIASIEVVYVAGPKEPTKYMHVVQRASKGDTRYSTTAEILSNRDTRNTLLIEALRELSTFRRKYAMLSELANLIPIIDSNIESMKRAVGDE